MVSTSSHRSPATDGRWALASYNTNCSVQLNRSRDALCTLGSVPRVFGSVKPTEQLLKSVLPRLMNCHSRSDRRSCWSCSLQNQHERL
jgi:hypothetical protein